MQHNACAMWLLWGIEPCKFGYGCIVHVTITDFNNVCNMILAIHDMSEVDRKAWIIYHRYQFKQYT